MSTVVGELMEEDNGQSAAAPQAMAIATSRQAQEVQAAMIVARRFPRDEIKAVARIEQACKRKLLAEASQYEYKRGGTLITGPSIRLAEVMAQCWGNLDFGIIELERKSGETVAMAYCWDLETNVQQTKEFTVRHLRDTKQGPQPVRDERDVYEIVASNGARRLRACVLGVIPGDIQDIAIEACDKTLAGDNKEPLVDRIRKMVKTFADIGVRADMLETKLGHKLDAATPRELAKLGRVFTSIRDGIATIEEHFQSAPTNGGKPSLDSMTEQLEAKVAKKSQVMSFPDFLTAVDACTELGSPSQVHEVCNKSGWTDEQRAEAANVVNAKEDALRPERGTKTNKKQGELV